jgi:hypothetical protein
VQAADLQPFSASYTADWKQLPMSGTAERSLVKNANGSWTLNFKASMMIASLTESSLTLFDKDTLLPQSYHFERGGLGKAKRSTWTSTGDQRSHRPKPRTRSSCPAAACSTSRPTSWRCSAMSPPARRA